MRAHPVAFPMACAFAVALAPRPRVGATVPANPEVPFAMPAPVAPVFPARVFDIRTHGAVEGGAVLNTEAIRAAIEACAQAGGGRVLVPAGVWLTGAIHLRSRVELHLAGGAELRFSRRRTDYLPVVFTQRGGVRCHNYSPLIYGRACVDVAVTGAGVLNGQGDAWWPWAKRPEGMRRLREAGAKGVPVERRVFGTEADGVRPPFVQMIDCRNVLIQGVTVRDGPSWNVHPVRCDNVIVRGIRVLGQGPNNDGIDPESCRNVWIEDCELDTGDDCICLKSGLNEDAWSVGRPCENVVIRRCITRRGHGGVVLGSEMSAGIRNVYVHDCRFEGTDRGIRIKSAPGRGGLIENIRFQRIAMAEIRGSAIQITLRYGDGDPPAHDPHPPRIRNVSIRDVECRGAARAIEIVGLPDNPIRGIEIVRARLGAGRCAECVELVDARLENLGLPIDVAPAMRLLNCRDVTVRLAGPPAGPAPHLRVDGPRSAGIWLGSDGAWAEVRLGEDAPRDAVVLSPES